MAIEVFSRSEKKYVIDNDTFLSRKIHDALLEDNIRNEFMRKFEDLSKLKKESGNYNDRNIELSEEERFGLSVEQYRDFDNDRTDTMLLKNEKIPLVLKDGRKIEISRKDFSEAILQSKYNEYFKLRLKDDIKKGDYSKLEKFKKLFDNAVENYSFMDSEYPYLTINLAKSYRKIKNNKKMIK